MDDEDKQDAVCRMMTSDYGFVESEIKRYSGVMGVPISFLDKYCPDQFEIIGSDFEVAQPIVLADGKRHTGRFYINGNRLYTRILIKRK